MKKKTIQKAIDTLNTYDDNLKNYINRNADNIFKRYAFCCSNNDMYNSTFVENERVHSNSESCDYVFITMVLAFLEIRKISQHGVLVIWIINEEDKIYSIEIQASNSSIKMQNTDCFIYELY